MTAMNLARLIALTLLLAGCAQPPTQTAIFRPWCGATNGPMLSPPAPPVDYTLCYPDRR